MEYRPILPITERFCDFLGDENMYFSCVPTATKMRWDQYFREEIKLNELVPQEKLDKKEGTFYQVLVAFEEYESKHGDYISNRNKLSKIKTGKLARFIIGLLHGKNILKSIDE